VADKPEPADLDDMDAPTIELHQSQVDVWIEALQGSHCPKAQHVAREIATELREWREAAAWWDAHDAKMDALDP
jgi:hypothetical protein